MTTASPFAPVSLAPGARPASAYAAPRLRTAMTDAGRRADAQQHLDARAQRISAYAASLEASLAAKPTGDRAEVLLRRLEQARQDLVAASAARLADPVQHPLRARYVRLRPAAAATAPLSAVSITEQPA